LFLIIRGIQIAKMHYLTINFKNYYYGINNNHNNIENTFYELQTKEKFSFKRYNGFFFSSWNLVLIPVIGFLTLLYLAYRINVSGKTRGLTLNEFLIILFEWKRTFKRTLERTVMSVLFKPKKENKSVQQNYIHNEGSIWAVIIAVIIWGASAYWDWKNNNTPDGNDSDAD